MVDMDGNDYSHALPIQLLDSLDAILGRRADGSGYAVLAPTGVPISIGSSAQDAWNTAKDTAARMGRRRLQGAIDEGVSTDGGTSKSGANESPFDEYDEMGQPLRGRSHFNRWGKMREIWNSNLSPREKLVNEWGAFNYTVPDAKQRIREAFGQEFSSGKRVYGLDFALGFPFTIPLGVGMAMGADDQKLQVLDQLSSGLMGAGGAMGEALATPKPHLQPTNALPITSGLQLHPREPGTEATPNSGRSFDKSSYPGSLGEGLERAAGAGVEPPELGAWDEEDHVVGPGSLRSPLGENVSYPDPAPRTYGGGFSPDKPVIDHLRARALGGHPTDPSNLYGRPWEQNAIKGGHEGNYLRDKAQYVQNGLTPEQAEWVLEDYSRWIQNDIHATPVDPETLNGLPSP